MRRHARFLLVLLRLAVLLCAGIAAALWFMQESLLFVPEKLPAGHDFKLPPDAHEAWVEVDGARLHALHLQRPGARGVVFFLHGNGGSLAGWFADLDLYRQAGYDLFMLDYRGYGKSSGRITSEAQLHADVRRAWEQLAPQYAGRKRVIYGRSIGSGLAAQLAAGLKPGEADLLVLVSPYLSLQRLAQDKFPWAPGFLLRYPLRTDLALPQARMPVLLVHGDEDTLIPVGHSLALKALRPDAELLRVDAGGHNDLQLFGSYQDRLQARLAALR